MKIRRRWLDLTLATLFVVSLTAVLLAHDSDFLRKPFCAALQVCPSINNASAWKKIAYDLGIGGLTSLLFYVLLVRLPDWGRRRRIRHDFVLRYSNFKYDCIALMVGLVEGSYSPDLVEELVAQQRFRDWFKMPVSNSQDRWGRFLDRLSERPDVLRELLTIFEIFREEIQFVVASVDIREQETFEFFKRLSAAIHGLKDTTVEYDPVKSLARFLWELLAGWSFSEDPPYRKEDIVQKMIESI